MIVRQALWQTGRRGVSRWRCLHNTTALLSPAETATATADVDTDQPPSLQSSLITPIAPLETQYSALKQQKAQLETIGSQVSPHYKPHTLVTHPPYPSDITLELLLASEAHLGHSTSRWHPGNARYIYGVRQDIHIISLESTAAHLRRACRIVTEVTRNGGLVLFVGNRKGQSRCVVKAAELSGGYHLPLKWIPGSITNGQQILGHCGMKVVDEFDNPVLGFEPQLAERPVLKPDLVVVLNPRENKVLLHECSTNQIPSIGIIDTDTNPTLVTYPIPANDDSLRCVQVICGVLGRAGQIGREQRLESARHDKITFTPADNLKLPSQFKDNEPTEDQNDSEDVTR